MRVVALRRSSLRVGPKSELTPAVPLSVAVGSCVDRHDPPGVALCEVAFFKHEPASNSAAVLLQIPTELATVDGAAFCNRQVQEHFDQIRHFDVRNVLQNSTDRHGLIAEAR